MPLPRRLGRFNQRVTNRILGPIVARLPWFGLLDHVGRRSGRRYRTPVMLFGSGTRRVIAMTYGPATDWARNVVAAGDATVTQRGHRLRLTDPRVVHDPTRHLVPRPIGWALGLLDASDFLVLTVVPTGSRAPSVTDTD